MDGSVNTKRPMNTHSLGIDTSMINQTQLNENDTNRLKGSESSSSIKKPMHNPEEGPSADGPITKKSIQERDEQ